jgi:hypothetical protein
MTTASTAQSHPSEALRGICVLQSALVGVALMRFQRECYSLPEHDGEACYVKELSNIVGQRAVIVNSTTVTYFGFGINGARIRGKAVFCRNLQSPSASIVYARGERQPYIELPVRGQVRAVFNPKFEGA